MACEDTDTGGVGTAISSCPEARQDQQTCCAACGSGSVVPAAPGSARLQLRPQLARQYVALNLTPYGAPGTPQTTPRQHSARIQARKQHPAQQDARQRPQATMAATELYTRGAPGDADNRGESLVRQQRHSAAAAAAACCMRGCMGASAPARHRAGAPDHLLLLLLASPPPAPLPAA